MKVQPIRERGVPKEARLSEVAEVTIATKLPTRLARVARARPHVAAKSIGMVPLTTCFAR